MSTVTTALRHPTTGRDFARARLAMGLSLRAIAQQVGAAHHTIGRWETSDLAIAEPLATEWRQALQRLAAERAAQLAETGYLTHVRSLQLGALLRAYAPGAFRPDYCGAVGGTQHAL